jgi:hypothetical protein
VQQQRGLRGCDRREDRETERTAELRTGVQESGGETRLVLVDPGVRRRRRADEDGAQAEGDDEQSGQDVRDVGAAGRILDSQ